MTFSNYNTQSDLSSLHSFRNRQTSKDKRKQAVEKNHFPTQYKNNCRGIPLLPLLCHSYLHQDIQRESTPTLISTDNIYFSGGRTRMIQTGKRAPFWCSSLELTMAYGKYFITHVTINKANEYTQELHHNIPSDCISQNSPSGYMY